MPIQSFSQIPTQPQLNPDAVVTRGAGPGGQLELREPLNPPGRWTQFKAALASVPLLGNLGSLRQARAEVDAYPVKLGQYQATNRQMLAGLHEELRNAYGGEIADMTLRNMGIADGAPLTARTVSTALEGARRAQQSCRSLNNMMATRLLESPLAGGQKLRGEKDMTDVFLDRGLEMRGASSWQEAVGPGAAKFITQQVMQRCAQLPEHARGALANEQVARAMDEALAAYQEIAGAPGMTPDKLQKILGDASTQKTPGAGLVRAREMVLAQSAEVLLDRKNPESFLRQEAGRVAERFGMPPLSDKVLKAIGGSMADQVSQSNYGQVVGQLGLAPDASLETAVPALRARLETNTRQALEGHYEALRMIEDSATLSDPQKAQLRQVATERRLDPEQVRQFERLAGSVGAAARELGRGDASTALGTLQRLMVDMQQAMRAMQDHAGGMWLQNTVSGDAGNKTFEIAAQLAATALPPEQARELLAALTGDGMKQFVQQVASGASGMVREQVTQLVGEMVLAVAARAGLGADEAMAQVRSVTNQPELPRESIPPGRLMDLMRADRNLIDARGVLETAPHGNLVSPDFSAEGVVREQSADFLGHVGRGTVDEARGISSTFVADSNRATFTFNGVTQPKGDSGAVLRALDDSFPPTPEGAAMKKAVSMCMNQRGINPFVEGCNQSAFGAMSMMGMGQVGSQYEATRGEDGSWTVRCTSLLQPQRLETPDKTTSFEPDALAAYSVTYKVGPGVDGSGNPTIAIAGSSVAYDI